jgi:hypothetical protein
MPEVALKLIDVFGEKCLPQHIDNYGFTALMYVCEYKLPNVDKKLINLLRIMQAPKPEVAEDSSSNPPKRAKLQ